MVKDAIESRFLAHPRLRLRAGRNDNQEGFGEGKRTRLNLRRLPHCAILAAEVEQGFAFADFYLFDFGNKNGVVTGGLG